MPKYLLVPRLNKSITEIDTWTNQSEETVTTCNYYRWCEIFVTCAEKPVIDFDKDNGVNIFDYFQDEYERGDLDYNLDDCYRSDISGEYASHIVDLWDEQNDLSEDGWDITDTELWIYTDLDVIEV